jgi:exosortase N
MMSPVFGHFIEIFSFPIRLQLTSVAASLFQASGVAAFASGNVIDINGSHFSVDAECMGLNMMVTSLLVGVMLMAYYEQTLRKKLKLFRVVTLLSLIVLLNVISNLIRILLIVQFRYLPGTIMHEAVGILCFVCYVVFPAWKITQIVVRRSMKAQTASLRSDIRKRDYLMNTLAFAALSVGMFTASSSTYAEVKPVHVNGFSIEHQREGVVKLHNEKALVYLKSIRGFYDTEHNPMLCWTGSGYQMTRIAVGAGTLDFMYTGVLESDNERLYTAWWYDNGKSRTRSQLEWRIAMLKGEPGYSLVNVTAGSPAELQNQVRNLLQSKIL